MDGRRIVLTMCAVAAAAAGSADAAQRRAFEIADQYRAVTVASPSGAPGGSLVVFEARRYSLEEGESWSEIWLVGSDGNGMRQMTFGRHHDGSPAMAPDGRSLIFVSDRSGEAQLWRMPVDGGEARQLTRFPGGVASPVWSPDGTRIAVVAEVYPECGAEAECNRTTRESVEKGPLAVRVTDELLYRHWDSWREDRFRHVLLVDADTGRTVADLTPGRWDSPVFSLGGHPGFAFSPDGRELAVASNRGPSPATSTGADLWLIPIREDGTPGEAVNATAGNPGWDGDPSYSPDGRYVAFRSQETPGNEADLFRLALLDRRSGEVRHLTDRRSFDNWIEGVAWGGRTLFVQAAVRGRNPLFTVDLESGRLEQVVVDGTIDAWLPAVDGGSVVYVRRAVDRPSELARYTVGEPAPQRLTFFNRALEQEVDIRPVEEMWVTRGDGVRIHVFLVTPHGFDPAQRYPLILNIHGGPQMQWTDSFRGDWQVYPGKGYVVAFANPTGSTGYGQALTDGISCDWGGQVIDDLMLVTDALAGLPYVDPERLGAMGWSWGGYAVMWLEGHSSRFKALASMMGVYDLRSMHGSTEELWFPEHEMCGTPWTSAEYERWSPSRGAEGFSTPCLVVTGERDFRVPYTQSLHFFTDLQRRGVPSRLVVYPDAGHWPGWYEMAFYYLVHLDWFHSWLGGEEPPWPVAAFARNQVFVGGGD